MNDPKSTTLLLLWYIKLILVLIYLMLLLLTTYNDTIYCCFMYSLFVFRFVHSRRTTLSMFKNIKIVANKIAVSDHFILCMYCSACVICMMYIVCAWYFSPNTSLFMAIHTLENITNNQFAFKFRTVRMCCFVLFTQYFFLFGLSRCRIYCFLLPSTVIVLLTFFLFFKKLFLLKITKKSKKRNSKNPKNCLLMK